MYEAWPESEWLEKYLAKVNTGDPDLNNYYSVVGLGAVWTFHPNGTLDRAKADPRYPSKDTKITVAILMDAMELWNQKKRFSLGWLRKEIDLQKVKEFLLNRALLLEDEIHQAQRVSQAFPVWDEPWFQGLVEDLWEQRLSLRCAYHVLRDAVDAEDLLRIFARLDKVGSAFMETAPPFEVSRAAEAMLWSCVHLADPLDGWWTVHPLKWNKDWSDASGDCDAPTNS